MKKYNQNEQLKNLFLRNCFLLVVIFLFQNISAQKKYHPLLNNTNWCVSNGFFWSERNDWYEAISDSITNSVTYKKFTSKANQYVITLLREDTILQRVWKFDGTKEILLYDFNLNVGDTLYYYYNTNGVLKLVLMKVDSINITAGWRQRFIFNDGTIVIESIGSLFYPVEIRSIVQDDNRGVICSFQQNSNTYSANNYPCVPYGQCAVKVIPTPATCFGSCDGQAKAYFVGSGAITYNWSNPNINNLCSGNISVSAQDDDGCISYSSANITEPAQLIISTSTTPAASGNADGSATANVTGGSPAYSYAWSNGTYGQTAINLVCGPYTVTISDANGCSATSAAVVNCISGIYELNRDVSFSVFPNPAKNELTIELTEQLQQATKLNLCLYDNLGKEILCEVITNTKQQTINTSCLSNGFYLARLFDEKHNSLATQKIVVE